MEDNVSHGPNQHSVALRSSPLAIDGGFLPPHLVVYCMIVVS